MLVSIVIPVYNVEPWIRTCLDSVLRQGLDEYGYEVIMVDDGGSDGSVAICEEYCKKYPNFRLIHQQNSGVSVARNHGIDEARGKYIVLLDADDYLLDDGLRKAYEPFADRDDIDVVHYYSSYDHWPKKPIDNTVNFDGTGHGFIEAGDLPSFCWLCFYRKGFLDDHNLRFHSGYVVGEDQLFASSVYLSNPRLVSTKADIYRYVVRQDSASTRRSVEHTRKCVDDYIDSYVDILRCMEKNGVKAGTPIYDMCIKRLNSKKMFGVSRIMSAEYDKSEWLRIRRKCEETTFWPVLRNADGWRHGMVLSLMNGLMRHYWIYKPMSIVFNKIVVPYVLPRMRRNF